MRQQENIIIDLETAGTSLQSAILSIGAVSFDICSGALYHQFYVNVNKASCLDAGLMEEASTLAWWSKRSAEAKKALQSNPLHLKLACQQFNSWVTMNALSKCRLWGNGCNFDNVIIRHAFTRVGLDFPIPYWKDRDLRTLKDLAPKMDTIPFIGIKHYALDDAIHEAKIASTCWPHTFKM